MRGRQASCVDEMGQVNLPRGLGNAPSEVRTLVGRVEDEALARTSEREWWVGLKRANEPQHLDCKLFGSIPFSCHERVRETFW